MNHYIKKILITIIISFVFFLILFTLSTDNIVTTSNNLKIEPLNVLLALIPFIIWLILTDKLKEIKGPGGIGVTLKDEADKSISLYQTTDYINPIKSETIEKRGINNLLNNLSNKYNTLSFEIGKKNYYDTNVIFNYYHELKRKPDFKYILFNDYRGIFKGVMKKEDFDYILHNEDLVRLIESGNILNLDNVLTDYIHQNSSNKEALDLMVTKKINFLAVVNDRIELIGFIKQENIVSGILNRIIQGIK